MTRIQLLSRVLALAALAGFGLGALRVYELERAEIEYEGPVRELREHASARGSSRISARLGSAKLGANQRAVFELCAQGGLAVESFEGAFDVAVILLDAKQLMLRVPLDRAHLDKARKNSLGACLLIGSGLLEKAGTYSVDVIYPAGGLPSRVEERTLGVRILAKSELQPRDRNLVAALGLALLCLLGLQLHAAPRMQPRPPDLSGSFTGSSVGSVPALALLASALVFSVSELPLAGPSLTLAKGFGLFALQCTLALLLARSHDPPSTRAEQLALRRPQRPIAALGLALTSWPLLVSASMVALRVVPSTGEAPIQTFISWPSGMLATALLGLLLPLGEELFFRGYLYGALLAYGRTTSAAVNVLVFGSLHAVQSWGNWGGLLAVFAAGLVFLSLRIITGSVLVAALVHVAYNLTLSLASLRDVGAPDGG